MLPENQTNKSPDKPYNQTIPRSQRDGGSNLDDGCGDIGQAEAGMDEVFGELIQSAAQGIENSPIGQAVTQGFNAGDDDESNSEAVSGLGGAVGSLVEIPAEAAATVAGNAANALMMPDQKRKRKSGRDDTQFSRETTAHEGSPENGPSGLPMMSAAGKKLASKTAPQSAYQTTTIGTSAVDRMMRGRKS